MSSIPFWWSLGFALAMIIIVQIQACPEDERRSLLDVKSALKDFSGRLLSWQGYNCCQWQGVVCDSRADHIIHLDLKNRGAYSQNFSGEIHPSLFNLQHLQYLDLSYNDFNASVIPSQLAKLRSLAFLSLSFAGFGGEIPMELGNMSTLRHLDLSQEYDRYGSELKSTRFAEWVRNLRSLKYLAMEKVNLTMASRHWGDALTTLSNLREVHLSFCGLSGSIPSLLNLTHLTHLHLGGNSFSCSMPTWFQNVSSLISLDLSSCGLRGIIPSKFLHLSRLSDLDLSDNSNLRGNISFILSHSSSLTTLSLGGWHKDSSSIGGVIPFSIGNFSKLVRLDLGFNNLTGEIPFSIGRLASLRYLDLSHNQISGPIPEAIAELFSLKELHLRHNQINGTILGTIPEVNLTFASNSPRGKVSLALFDNLTQIEALDLSQNHFTVKISSNWIPQFVHLKFLGLSSCNLEGGFPAFLSTQYSLTDLDLSNNSIVGSIPTWLWDLPSLGALNLSDNKLDGPLPHLIPNSLDFMDLHRNGLQGSLPIFRGWYLDLSENEFNGSCSILATTAAGNLWLSGNKLGGFIPDSLCSENNNLVVLDLSKNSLSGKIPPNLGTCSSLEVLNLAQNDLQGEILQEWGNLTALSRLNLNDNHLQGIIPSSLANCKNLHLFDVGHNKLEGSIPVWMGELTHLQILSFTSNNFRGKIPPQLISLQNLQILDLSHNNLSGIIPQKLTGLHAMINPHQSAEILLIDLGLNGYTHGNLNDIVCLDRLELWIKGQEMPYKKISKAHRLINLSYNRLSGNIPSEMGLLKGLISLNISRNNLSGLIPGALGGMAQLQSLDLSGNKLSGKIPQQLVNLTFLEVLNLSDNRLSGLIPQGKQFSTFEASSFAGNPNLHGFPLDNTTALKAGRSERGNQQEMNSTKAEAEEDKMDRWWAVALGLSFGVGFGLVVGVLCFHVQWRIKYFAILDGVVAYLFDH